MPSFISKALVTYGLVILTGPLCFTAWAQGYVDLEAERAAANAAGRNSNSSQSSAPDDPYGARPAQAYPATSYGVDSAPTAPSGVVPAQTSSASPPGAPAPVAGMGSSEGS